MLKIYYVGGSKGGVGKSFMSIALTDYLARHKQKNVMLLETDTSNPDVGKTFSKDDTVEVVTLQLDDVDGWIELVNLCDKTDKDIIVNSAARSNESIAKFSGTLTESLSELKRELVTFWIINRQRDSIELLKKYMEVVTVGSLHVVRNTYYGDPQKFEMFNNSKLRAEAEQRGVTMDFPDLADRVADDLYSNRLTVAAALEALPLGSRAELKRWRSFVWKALDELNIGNESGQPEQKDEKGKKA